MTERLRQQVAEIRQRAHVCPRCSGKGGHPVVTDSNVINVCFLCNGTGQVPAPDTDALCDTVERLLREREVLAQAVEARKQRSLAYVDRDTDPQAYMDAVRRESETHFAALALLRDGLPQPTSVCEGGAEYSTDSVLESPTLHETDTGRTTGHESGTLNTRAANASCSDNSEGE